MRIVLAALVFASILSATGCSGEPNAGTCEDVTSYDHDWNNDMLCTRTDGSTFYTDYAGAKVFRSTSN